MATKNKWLVHLSATRKKHPELAKSRPGSADFKKLIVIAKKSYK